MQYDDVRWQKGTKKLSPRSGGRKTKRSLPFGNCLWCPSEGFAAVERTPVAGLVALRVILVDISCVMRWRSEANANKQVSTNLDKMNEDEEKPAPMFYDGLSFLSVQGSMCTMQLTVRSRRCSYEPIVNANKTKYHPRQIFSQMINGLNTICCFFEIRRARILNDWKYFMVHLRSVNDILQMGEGGDIQQDSSLSRFKKAKEQRPFTDLALNAFMFYKKRYGLWPTFRVAFYDGQRSSGCSTLLLYNVMNEASRKHHHIKKCWDKLAKSSFSLLLCSPHLKSLLYMVFVTGCDWSTL